MTDTTPNEHNQANEGAEQNQPPTERRENGSDARFYRQAMSLCQRALDAGALQEAMLWAQQAELMGSATDPQRPMPEVAEAYSRIMLDACLLSQELALTTGNVLPQHKELSELIDKASDRLSTRLHTSTNNDKMVALMAQGFARKHTMHLKQPRVMEITNRNKPGDLDELLETLSNIERCATELCANQDPQQTKERKIVIAKTAVSNARYSLSRLFSKHLSDWTMAELFCRRAFMLLAKRPITDGFQPSGNAELDGALTSLPEACDALRRRSYQESAEHLKTISERLERAKPGPETPDRQ